MSALIGSDRRPVTVQVFLETFDVYVRSVAEIAAEAGLSGEDVSVEALMAYCLSLPEVDDLVLGFLRGDLTVYSLSEQTREVVERDMRFLALQAPTSAEVETVPNRLAKKLEMMRRIDNTTKASELDAFIRENSTVFEQIRASSHEFLVRWVMLHLMQTMKERERGHRVAHEFWTASRKQQQAMRQQTDHSVTVSKQSAGVVQHRLNNSKRAIGGLMRP